MSRRLTSVVALLPAVALLLVAVRGGSYGAVPRTELFALGWWTLTLAVALGLLPRYRPSPPVLLGIGLLFGLAAWTALTTLWSPSAERTFAEITRVLGFAGLLLLVATAIGARDAARAGAALAVAAVAVCALALLSRVAPQLLPSPLAAAGVEGRRLAYPLNYWNALGCWAAMTVALCLAWSAHARTWWARGAAVAGVPVAVTVAYLTYSRAAVLSVALAVVLVVALSRHRWTAFVHGAVAACGSALLIVTVRSAPGLADGTGVTGVAGAAMIVSVAAVSVACMAAAYGLRGVPLDAFRAGRRATRRALAGVVLVVVLLGATMGPAIASDAWHSFRSPATVDTGDPTARLSGLGGPRHELYDVALRAFRAHPLGGVGAGTFELVWNRERPIVLSVRDAHSLYLEALAEVGIVGAALVVGAIVALVAAVLRARRAARSPEVVALTVGAAAAAIVWALDAGVDWMWESTAVTVGALTVATVAAGALARQARRPRVRLRTAATVAGLAALALQAPLLVASSRLADSQKAFARGDLQTALDAATTASQAEPWASTPLLQRAQVLESSGQLASADRAAVAATRRDGEDWRTWIVLARIDAERGQLRPAVRAAERARRLNPRSPLFAPPRRARTG